MISHARPNGVHQLPRILKFLPTLDADLVGSLLDSEHAAQMTVMTTKDKVEN